MPHIDINSLKHFAICLALTAALGILGMGIAIGASVTKEWCDLQFYGHWCWFDIAFDTLGIATGALIHVLILSVIGVL